MEIAVILLSMGLVLAIGVAFSYKKERDDSDLLAKAALVKSEELADALARAEYFEKALEGNKLITEAVRKDLSDAESLMENIKQLSINDRTALKSALDESDLSNAEARKFAKKVQILQTALNEEQNMIIELENKIDSLKAKAKKAKAKKPVKKRNS